MSFIIDDAAIAVASEAVCESAGGNGISCRIM